MLDTVAATDDTERSATIRATLKEFFSELDSKGSTGLIAKFQQKAQYIVPMLLSKIHIQNKSVVPKNKIIFGGMVKGMTEQEIAPAVGISQVATHNRMAKIRAKLAELL